MDSRIAQRYPEVPGHPAPGGPYSPVIVAGDMVSENVLEYYGRNSDVECVSLRFATIVGLGKLQRHAGPNNTYSSMIELPASGRPFTLDHGGDERDGIVYVLDVADAIACVALAPEPLRHHAYNVGSGSAVSMNEFAAAIRGIIPDAVLEVGPGKDPMNMPDPYYMALDGTRMEKEFGWRPRYDLDRAIRHYYDLVKSRTS